MCVYLRILASSRIPRYDLGRQTPHFWGGSTFWSLSFVNLNTWHLICNNFNLNFIFGTVCICVCVCAFSLRRESPDMILWDKPLISELVLSQLVLEQDWSKTHMKASKNHNNAFGEERLAHIRTLVVSLGGKLTYVLIYETMFEPFHPLDQRLPSEIASFDLTRFRLRVIFCLPEP
jgi:hypothetical protein